MYNIKALKTFQLIENWVFLKDILKKDYQRVVILPFCWGHNFQSQILKRGGLAKNECLGGLKEFLAWIFAWRAYILFFSPKKLLKMKYGFESSISNVVLNFEDLIRKVNETIYRLFTDHLTQIHKALFIYHVQFVQKVLVSTT